MSWDGFQREVLLELGLRPYVLAGSGPAKHEALSAAPEASVAPSVNLSPKLVAALARAAGCAPAQVVSLAGIVVAPADAAAKRALWPRLRQLRSSTSR